MQGILTGRNTGISVLLLLVAGFLLTRYLGPRMGEFRRSRLAEVNRALPPAARAALLRVGAGAFALDLSGETLELIAVPDGVTVYLADVARLRALVEEVARLAEALLATPS